MQLKSIRVVKNLKNKIVLLRADFNVPLTSNGRVAEDLKIRETIPTIKYLLAKKAKVVILSHLGRPKGKIVAKYSNRPIALKLGQILAKKVAFCPETIGPQALRAVRCLKAGQVLMLENVRFNKAEEKVDLKYAKSLAALGDVYVNDAFAVSHRAQNSLTGITKFLSAFAGLLMEKEVRHLSQVLESKAKPKIAIIGGAKLETKVKVIKNLLKNMDYVLLGGAIANNFLKALNYEVGRSLIDAESLKTAAALINDKLRLPVDVVVASKISASAKAQVKLIDEVKPSDIILDLGQVTVKNYSALIKSARLVVWNGPLGYFEISRYKRASQKILQAISQTKAYKVIGGGETIQLIQNSKFKIQNSFISTGGGAMLEFLAGKIPPGIKPLIKK